MKFPTDVVAVVGTWAIGTAVASPMNDIFKRAIGDPCSSPDKVHLGTCEYISDCTHGVSHSEPYCPKDGNDIQCCVVEKCYVEGVGHGTCRQAVLGDPRYHEGQAPNWPCPNYGPDIHCFIDGPAPDGGGSGPASTNPVSHNPNTGGDTLGQRILDAALTQGGKPYVSGSGGCGDSDAFDCSGLVGWAVCEVTGWNLRGDGFVTTDTMWCGNIPHVAVDSDLKAAGDVVFFSHNGDRDCQCGSGENNYHMGLVMEDTSMMWTAQDYGYVVEAVPIADFETDGNVVCSEVLRFV